MSYDYTEDAIKALSKPLADYNHQYPSENSESDARYILEHLPAGWALEPLCGDCGYPLRDWAGHACPGQ